MEAVGRQDITASIHAQKAPDMKRSQKLCSLGDWAQMLEASKTQPVLVFKHSTSCGISNHVLQEVEDFLSTHETLPMGIVQVIENRGVSNAIAEQTGVQHETPQLILVSNERTIWHASHWSIDLTNIDALLSSRCSGLDGPGRI